MIDIAIRVLAVLLLIGAGLHAWGSLLAFKPNSAERVWSLGSAAYAIFLSGFAWLVVGLHEPTLNWLLAFGCASWFLTVAAFGRAIGTLRDPRVLYHLVVVATLGVLAVLQPS